MDVDILLTVEVDCLLPRHGGASIQSRAHNNSDEIGIRPDIPVEARGAGGSRQLRAGNTGEIRGQGEYGDRRD